VKDMRRNQQNRNALKIKMAQALNEEVKTLSTQLQDILIDDLITAFENRFVVLNKTQSNLEFTIEVGVKVPQ
jgi:hypothetical protein